MAAAFRDLLSNLLAPFDVLMTDAADPQLKQASIPVLRHELESAAAHEKLLHLTSDRLVQSGITPQVPILPSASNLFLRTDQGRERLLQSQRGWITRDSGEHYSLDELKQILAAEPARFSPNVLLRPVVESHVFPVLAYVAGPAECSYFAQLGELFGAHGLAMPLVYPRASLTLVEAHMQKRLERIGLTADDLQTPRHLLVHRHSRASVPTAVQDALRALRTVVVAHFDALAETVAEHDHSLDIPLGTLRNRALLVIGDAESKIVRAVAGGQKQWQGDLDSILDYLLPLGSGQERVVNVLPFLARHGPSLLRAVYETIPVHFEVPRGKVALRAEQHPARQDPILTLAYGMHMLQECCDHYTPMCNARWCMTFRIRSTSASVVRFATEIG